MGNYGSWEKERTARGWSCARNPMLDKSICDSPAMSVARAN